MSELTREKEMLKLAIEALEDKKAVDIKVIDITGISTIADYFNVDEKLGRSGYTQRQIEGYETANWILMDYKDIIIHIFDHDNRLFYDIERIWRDGKEMAEEELKAL